ncbi:2-iminoacetate synthase ThiH [Succinimonas amylolytica]|uniref:2-iminoacetate synthase ThiH n=1 Tax=Succinimonas amylolytica TaxID=83769 RepID=UPI00037CA1C7|nr:2-iminoacetate synthase ThiH [Succinimonas amylolytica]
MSFYDEITAAGIAGYDAAVDACTDGDVSRALSKSRTGDSLDLGDFMALISPRATPYLSDMAVLAEQYTRRRFGNTVSMYLPLYLSNLCLNNCRYCGFAAHNRFPRKFLTAEETRLECEAIRRMGYENILVVSGEDPRHCGMEYFREQLRIVNQYASYMSLEIQPLDTPEYREMKSLGVDYVCVYQETYDPECYRENHLSGKKRDMRYRMETPERVGDAGIDKVGLGALLGLYRWKSDVVALTRHLMYMRRHYPETRLSISFPRLRPAEGGFQPEYPLSDRQMIQCLCAWRLFDRELEISISTRESPRFRDVITPVVITSISAGSSTQPGGYAADHHDLSQFVINDSRSVAEVSAALRRHGLEPVFREARSQILEPAGSEAAFPAA